MRDLGRGLPRVLKLKIWIRDGFICQYCGRLVKDIKQSKEKPLPSYAATVDHVVPKSKGGLEVAENMVTACFRCNNLLEDKFTAFEEKRSFIQENLGLILGMDRGFISRERKRINRKIIHERRGEYGGWRYI